MTGALTVVAALACAAWAYLVFLHGQFWRADQRLPEPPPSSCRWPRVAAVVPARNEADTIGRAVASLLRQDYPGEFSIVVVDDASEDGTADAVRRALESAGPLRPLAILAAPPLARGWTGKLAAVAAGVDAAPADGEYILLTDADVEHACDVVRGLVAHAECQRHDLISLMVRLRCSSAAEQWLIPAFVYFFQKLYPFRWINDRAHRTAGAAGGCMLVRRIALERIGGVAAIRDALIDDCALARALKRHGSIWLGHAEASSSLRRCERLSDVWNMVARTAYSQLRHSPLMLLGTVAGMLLLYAVPVLAPIAAVAFHAWLACALALVALALMLASYWPTWRLYRRFQGQFLLLPLAGLFYTLMTIDSARRHWRGHGGAWKGRTYSNAGPRELGPSSRAR